MKSHRRERQGEREERATERYRQVGGRKVFKRDHWDARCYVLTDCIFLSLSVSFTFPSLDLSRFLPLFLSLLRTKRERECAFTLYGAINSTRRL